MKHCHIFFAGTAHAPITLPAHTPLAERLTLQNSPILFGCRTGICGTCLAIVTGEIPPPQADEREVLAAIAPDREDLRLVCQIQLTADIQIAAADGPISM